MTIKLYSQVQIYQSQTQHHQCQRSDRTETDGLMGCVYTASLNAQSDLLTISNIIFLARLFTFTLDTTGIRYPCLHSFPPKRIVCSDRFTMHMVDLRVLNDSAIKISYIIHVEWPLLFASMDNGCHGCFAAQNLTERIKTKKITVILI